MGLPSASKLQRAFACIASAVLPGVERSSGPSDRGTAIHAFLADALENGRDDALTRVDREYRPVCEAIDLDQLPTRDPAAYLAEVAFVYDVATDTARELGSNLGRNYGELSETEIPGTLDILADASDSVFVGDYKSGQSRMASARNNWQIRVQVLMAARARGRSTGHGALIRLKEDGTAYWDVAEFDAFELDSIAADLRDLVGRIQAARVSTSEPATSPGDHCRYCPAFASCPAQTALIRVMAAEPLTVADGIRALLNPATAAKAYERLRAVEAALKPVREALYAYARETPIPLGDGVVLGEIATSREEIDAGVARRVLAKLHGPIVADAACDYETSKVAIDRALRPLGGKLAPLKREVLDAIREEGGITVKVSTTIKEHTPKRALLEDPEATIGGIPVPLFREVLAITDEKAKGEAS